MRRIQVALLVSVLVIPTGGFAQTQPSNESRNATIRIGSLQFPTEITREAVNREPLRLAPLPVTSRQQQRRERSWAGRHPVLFGALVGLGVGLGVEAAVIPGESGGEPHRAYLPIFGGMGAGIGSLVGLIVGARQ